MFFDKKAHHKERLSQMRKQKNDFSFKWLPLKILLCLGLIVGSTSLAVVFFLGYDAIIHGSKELLRNFFSNEFWISVWNSF